MAAPKLKVNTPAPGARPKLAVAAASAARPKLATGAAPTKRPTLLGAGGQAIKPKVATAATKPAVAPAVAAPEPVPAPVPLEAPTLTPESVVDIAAAEAEARAAEEAAAAAAAEAAAQAEAEAAAQAEAEAAAQAEAEAAAQAEAEAAAQAEAEAAAQAEAEAAAAAAEAAAQAEAEAAAQAEYERQMEEYNRQMEEYNRQMAEFQAQQAAAEAAAAAEPAQEEAPAPAPAAAAPKPAALKPKTAAPKPAALKPKAAAPAALKPKAASPKPKVAAPKPAAAPVPAHEATEGEPAYGAEEALAEAPEGMTEEQLSARDAYLQQLQTMAEKKPIYKTPIFYIALGALVALGIGCSIYVTNVNAERNARKAEQAATNAILLRAHEINKKQIETMADAEAKGYKVVCSKADAKKLLAMVVDPFAKDENGQNAYGASPKQTAQLACLLLALASEMDPDIDALIFKTLDKNASRMDASLFRALIQRMAVSNNKGINSKFRKLADSVAAKPKWNKKSAILSHIWEAMGLRVTEKDIPDIVSLLKGEDLDDQLAASLSLCLQNIIMMEEDMDKKKQIGDQIFTSLPEKHLAKMQGALGRSCSPKALEHFTKLAEEPNKWREVEFFFANFYSDEIVPFLVELRDKGKAAVEAAGEDKKALRQAKINLDSAEHMLKSVVGQNRERSWEEAEELLALVFDKLNVPADAPEEDQDASYNQKKQLLGALSGMHNHEWVIKLLDKLYDDAEPEISNLAKKAKEQVMKNVAQDAEMRSKHRSRDKQ